jgi:hypothetical protein
LILLQILVLNEMNGQDSGFRSTHFGQQVLYLLFGDSASRQQLTPFLLESFQMFFIVYEFLVVG